MKRRSGGMWIWKGLGIVGALAGAAAAGTALLLRSWAKDPESEDLRVIVGSSGKGVKLTKTEDGKVLVDTHYDAAQDPDMQDEDSEPRGPVLVLNAEEAAKKAEELAETAGEKAEECCCAAAKKAEECAEAAGEKLEECCCAAAEKAEERIAAAGEKAETLAEAAAEKAEECVEAAGEKIEELGREAGAAVEDLIRDLKKPEE